MDELGHEIIGDEPLTRVMALHSLAYCERLFYLEEVEEICLADEAVYAGRELHALLDEPDPTATEIRSFHVTSQRLGLTGRIDAFRRRGGAWTPYEHKKGQCARGRGGGPAAWPADRIQVGAYALLLEEALGEPVWEARIRYHQSGVTVRVPIDDGVRAEVRSACERARELRSATVRPPVTENPRLCIRCSLAPVCLPEEARVAKDPAWQPIRLFPPADDRQVLHVTTQPASVGRSGDLLVVRHADGREERVPVREVSSLVVHGFPQVTTQALHLCAVHDVSVHWVTRGGRYLAGTGPGGFDVQRRLRQFEALTNERFRVYLARRLTTARVSGQLAFILRGTRGTDRRRSVEDAINRLRAELRALEASQSIDEVRGHEGAAARTYFGALAALLGEGVDPCFIPSHRSRRPPTDRFNAVLSFLYSLLFREVATAIRAVGLEPALGFLHTPRSAAPPLALDLMELFRVPLCDIPLVASINRKQWDPKLHFELARDHVWLSDTGRRLAIGLFERRLEDSWKHPVLGYSLSYRRTIELEVRLLEKEWLGEAGLFARSRLR